MYLEKTGARVLGREERTREGSKEGEYDQSMMFTHVETSQ
jgi:hypothetical protein